ncbi:MAG: sulfite exporter TauE/SafE family protein [Rhizobiales bacterium]|nr:sulfite exporter TauE/SafE family protein [Hyphomicrobiales bacterium]
MILGVPAGEFAVLAAMIVLGGLVTGLLAGLFGVGGGAVIVPVLYEIFHVMGVAEDVRIKLCVGTSLAIILPTSIRSFRAHQARGRLPVEILRNWMLPVFTGVAVGAVAAAFAPAYIFKLAFAIMAALLAAKFLFGREAWRLGEKLPGRAAMAGYGFAIGLYSSLMGVGGGALATIVLTLYGVSMHIAVGISAGIGVIIAASGTAGYILAGLPYQAALPPLSAGFVSLIGVLLMAPISMFAAPIGARLAHALARRRLEIAFGIFLLLVSLRFLASLFI